MMVDASALLAILLKEPERDDFIRRVSEAEAPFTSPTAIYEAVVRLARQREYSVGMAREVLKDFLSESGIKVVAITEEMTPLALDAFARFGKGRHPAALNFGNCFAYACAKARDASLLYKGADFAQTDLA